MRDVRLIRLRDSLEGWGRATLRTLILHPLLVLAVPAAWWASTRDLSLPQPPVGIVDVVGMVRTLPEMDENGWKLELSVREAHDLRGEFPVAGRLLVMVGGSAASTPVADEPTLQPGYRVAFRTELRPPGHFSVPGVVDQRRMALARGVYWRAQLKSPDQLDRLGPEPGLLPGVLRWAGHYVAGFRVACGRHAGAESAAWIDALLLGVTGGIPSESWDRAAEVGLVHLLVVSGLHVATIAGPVLWVRRLAGWRVVPVVWAWLGFYVAVIGFPAPATRAAVAVGLACPALVAGIQFRSANALGLAALVILVMDPLAVHSRSFQLSFSATATLLLLAAPAWELVNAVLDGAAAAGSPRCGVNRDRIHRAGRWLRYRIEAALGFNPVLLRMVPWLTVPARFSSFTMVAGAAALAGSVPFVLLHTGLYPSFGLVANLPVLPVFVLLLPICFLALVAYWTPVGPGLIEISGRLTDLLRAAMGWVEDWGGGLWVRSPEVAEVACYFALIAVALSLPRFWKLPALTLPWLLAAWLVLRLPSPSGIWEVTFLDVGQGDAIHLSYPDGRHALVDTGGGRFEETNRLLARRVLAPYLLGQGVRGLEFVLLSHPESDHAGALPPLSRSIGLGSILTYEPGPVLDSPMILLQAGDEWNMGNVHHRVLHPPVRVDGLDRNDRSLVVLVRYGELGLLLTGDVGVVPERRLARILEPVTVLKVAHHGSRSSTSSVLLEAIRPAVAVISAGRRNPFGHPSATVTGRLDEASIPWFTTATHGSLRLQTDGREWWLGGYDAESREFLFLAGSDPVAVVRRD